VNESHIESITVVTSKSSGTGKTRYIRERLAAVERGKGARVGVINIHEGVTLTTLVAAMVSKFPRPCQKNAVCFCFTLMATDREADNSWMDVNQFFISLIVCRSVHDPISASSFFLVSGQWDVFIELQGLPSGVHNTSQHPRAWLRRFVPILAHCAQLVEPPKEYVVDAAARRVCTYLRAYDNGTINRTFEPYRRKCVVFVLDESGSMEAKVGARSALGVATDNALKLLDSHVQVDDVSIPGWKITAQFCCCRFMF